MRLLLGLVGFVLAGCARAALALGRGFPFSSMAT
jgi:hypothetical protein